jgi:two-component system, OmpR family, alkaline phosphatase synthesis response regulator PhoP
MIMAGNSHCILIVEDNRDLLNLLDINLTDQGYSVYKAENGLAALEKFQALHPDLVILDVMLPELDGFEVCKKIREEDKRVPILMLTAKAEEVDKVLGLELGADDYMTKPFSIREFLARVKAMFRRVDLAKSESKDDGKILEFDQLRVETSKRKVTLKGELLDLTGKEYELLLLFFNHPGKAYSREELLNTIWGYTYEGYSHTVNSHINRLRSKIEDDPSNPHYIRTVWGVGYRFADKEESRQHA